MMGDEFLEDEVITRGDRSRDVLSEMNRYYRNWIQFHFFYLFTSTKQEKKYESEELFRAKYPLFSEKGMRLVEEMIVPNRWARISAREALGHEYFY